MMDVELNKTCELCDTRRECLSGDTPCDLCGEYIAGPYRGLPGPVVAALKFYADPFKRKDEDGADIQVPDFYSELAFGDRAQAVLDHYRNKSQ